MDTEIKRKHPVLRKYWWIAPAAALLVAIGVWGWRSSTVSTYEAASSGIVIEEVVKGTFEDFIRVNGKVETGVTVQVSALETGIVEKKWVEEGAMVSEGDIILTLRNPNLQEQILESESQLAERQNMLRDTEIAMEKERLQIRQDLLTARTDLNRKRRLAEQQESLYKESLTSREEYLKAKEDYELARETFSLLQSRLRQDSLYRSVQVAMMRESLDNMQKNLVLVRRRADNLNVRATHSGQLGSLDAELGQNITMGQQVGQINILDNYKLTVRISEHYIDRVAPGLEGMSRRNGAEIPMRVRKVYPEVSQGEFKADLVFEGGLPAKIRVGQTYPVDIMLGDAAETVMVARGTFFNTSGGHWAYVVEKDGKGARKREISIGRQNPRYYEVLSGLEPGERIITSSYQDFGEAERVVISD